MKSITIHQIDTPLWNMIRARAKEEGKSLNQTIKAILEKGLGIRKTSRSSHYKDFEDVFGVWTEADLAEFNTAVADTEKVSAEDWK